MPPISMVAPPFPPVVSAGAATAAAANGDRVGVFGVPVRPLLPIPGAPGGRVRRPW